MRIVCPNCDAEYDVPHNLIGNGRRVRCARCGQPWEARAVDPLAPMLAEPGPSPMRETRLQPGEPASLATAPDPARAISRDEARPMPVHTDLGHADLGHADLGHADLGHADLGHADLGDVEVGDADPDGWARSGAASHLAAPNLAGMDSLRVGAAPGRMPRAVVMGWALSVAVLILLGSLAVQRREAVMAAWPASTRAYAAIGLANGSAQPLNAGSAASR